MNHLGDTNKMVSDTPRTEAEVNRQKCWSDDLVTIDANFACQLERELNAANQRIKRLEEDSDRLHWLLKRGLAWRGCYNGHWLEGEWLYSSQDAIETFAKQRRPSCEKCTHFDNVSSNIHCIIRVGINHPKRKNQRKSHPSRACLLHQ